MVKNVNMLRKVKGLTERSKSNISEYLKESVNLHVKTNPNEWFSANSLVGGENSDWRGTPLQALYTMYMTQYGDEDKAFKQAGIACGWILKEALLEDERPFETRSSWSREYKLS